MENSIQIYFTHDNTRYFGVFTPVMGAGDTGVYHFLINNFYQGRLRKNDKWVFDGKFHDRAEDFGNFLTFLMS
ncbi:hypothetical protein [Flavitalea sp.]|nr:hypothetical protein [Flavitalea sp.]